MKKLVLMLFTLLFIGCSDTPTLYNSGNYRGEPIQVADGVYLKKVYIQGMYALLQCDKDGKIAYSQNLNASYQEGKVFKHSTVVSITNTNFTFNCSNIDDCYEQVMIVKKIQYQNRG